MEPYQSDSQRKLDSNLLSRRSRAGAFRRPGRAAISGLLAASLAFFGVLYLGFQSHSPNTGNAPNREATLANAPFAPSMHAQRATSLLAPAIYHPVVANGQAAAPAASGTPQLIEAALPVSSEPAKSSSSAAVLAKGKQLFHAHTCSTCHGSTAQGTSIAPPLAGIGHYFSEATFSELIHHPNTQMTSKGMPPQSLSKKETHALWAYLNSMPVPKHRAPGVPAVVIFKKNNR